MGEKLAKYQQVCQAGEVTKVLKVSAGMTLKRVFQKIPVEQPDSNLRRNDNAPSPRKNGCTPSCSDTISTCNCSSRACGCNIRVMSVPEYAFLKTVVEALRNDVPKSDYSRLSKNTVQRARKELMHLLEATPGANFDNVKQLRAQISIAEQGHWSQLNKDFIEDAALEYFVLLKALKDTMEKQNQKVHEHEHLDKQPGGSKKDEPQPNVRNTEVNISPRLKKEDTEELFRRKKKEQQSNVDSKEEDGPLSGIKHEDTAESLRRQRSEKAGRKLLVGNPDIADLSDTNRPTRLAEMYMELYDNEWTDALEEITKSDQSEFDGIQQLLKYLESSFEYCKLEAKARKDAITEQFKTVKGNKEQTELRVQEEMKQVTDDEVSALQKSIGDDIVGEENIHQLVRSYIDECIRLTYLMNVQNPPMVLYKPDLQSEFKAAYFKEYTRKGKKVEYVVLPALLLYSKGPVAAKGVVQLT